MEKNINKQKATLKRFFIAIMIYTLTGTKNNNSLCTLFLLYYQMYL